MTRRRRTLPMFTVALGAVLAGAGGAAAADLCVDRTGCDAGHTFAGDLQAALDAAAATPAADRVLVGPGTYARAGASGFSYASSSPVEIAGNEGEATVISTSAGLAPGGYAIDVIGGAHVVRDLDVFVAQEGRRGIRVGGTSVLRDVLVTGEVGATTTGVQMAGTAALDRVTVIQEGAAQAVAVVAYCVCTIRDSSISTEGPGVMVSGSQVVVERTRIRARLGIDADSGGATVRDSLIRVVGISGVGVRARNANSGTGPITVGLQRVTIAGDGSVGQVGVWAAADDGDESADVTIDGSIVTGVAVPLSRSAAGGRSANITVRYANLTGGANLDGNTGGGTGAITATDHVTALPVTFTNPVQGDFSLQAGSALIDAGDPAAALTGVTDLGGTARPLDGDGDGTAVVDLGAVESAAVAVTPPVTPPATTPDPDVTAGPTVSAPVVTDLTPPRLRGGLLLKPGLRLRVSVAEPARLSIRLQRLVGTRWVNTGTVIRRSTVRRALLTVPLATPRVAGIHRVVVTAVDGAGNTFLLRGSRIRLGAR